MAIPYQKLGGNQIRLLQKVGGTDDRDLRFRFVYASLNHPPRYTALSYTWGSESSREKIFIENKPTMVTPTLWAGLHIVRRVWPLIWADFVCINQKDTLERNEQVRMMDRIYSSAAVVSVWLGLVPIPPHFQIVGKIVTTEVDELDWTDSMDDVASRPYWSRSWVIQEFLLAKEVHLYCGNQMVSEWTFRDYLSQVAGIDLDSTERLNVVREPAIMRQWPALTLLIERHIDRYPEFPQPLYDLLAGNAHTQSSEPRDRIFALLGLLPQDERAYLQRCFPDYRLTMDQIKLITMAHIYSFTPDEPCEPIFRALGIHHPEEIRRILWIVNIFDYIGADNPATDLEIYQDLFDYETVNEFDGVITSQSTLNSIFSREEQKLRHRKKLWAWLLGAGVLLSVGGLFGWRNNRG